MVTEADVHWLPFLTQIRKNWGVTDYCAWEFAQDALGRPCAPTDSAAQQWCVQGYAQYLLGIETPHGWWSHTVTKLLTRIARSYGGTCDMAALNNLRGHAAVCKALDAAILDLRALQDAYCSESGEEVHHA